MSKKNIVCQLQINLKKGIIVGKKNPVEITPKSSTDEWINNSGRSIKWNIIQALKKSKY